MASAFRAEDSSYVYLVIWPQLETCYDKRIVKALLVVKACWLDYLGPQAL